MSAHRTVFVLMPVEVDLYGDGNHIGRIRMPSVEEVSEAVGAGLFKSNAHPLPLPTAETLELDRAVQSEIARAFGGLIQVMVDAEHYLSIRGPDYADTADMYRRIGVRDFRRIIHTAMGGRIPDTTGTDHVEEATP